MKQATVRRQGTTFRHEIEIRGHRLLIDEPEDKGGEDEGPTPQELLAASLASCVAVTVEMYAGRKGWDVGAVEVECGYEPADPGAPTTFRIALRVPGHCTPEQLEKLRIIAAKCPVRRTLEGEVRVEERIEVAAAADPDARAADPDARVADPDAPAA